MKAQQGGGDVWQQPDLTTKTLMQIRQGLITKLSVLVVRLGLGKGSAKGGEPPLAWSLRKAQTPERRRCPVICCK
jgi:hypothetical protein